MIRTLTIALTGALALSLSACNQPSEPAARMGATPAENPKDPWATYAAPAWDHDREEVQKTPYGLEYVVLASGPECASGASGGETALVHYEGRLEDGTKFDSSFERGEPAQFPANRVITGWTRTLEMMCPGDDWMIYLPAKLAYGNNPPPMSGIKAGDALIFRLVLIDALTEANYDEDVWNGTRYN